MIDQQREALSLAIARSKEPEPTDGEWRNGLGRLSKSGFWFRHWNGPSGVEHFWPRSHREPEIAMRLMKDGRLTVRGYGNGWCAYPTMHEWDREIEKIPEFAYADEPADAIALAWAKSHGVEVSNG